MSESASSPLDPRTAFRYAVRERAMAVGLDQIKAEGWRHLRINQIAKEIGVSRPTLYAEFGTKEKFAQTLLDREMDSVFHEFEEALNHANTSAQKALTKAFTRLIRTSEQSPLVDGLLINLDAEPTASATEQIDSIGLQPFIDRCSEILLEWIVQLPDPPNRQVTNQVSEALSRLALSHIMTNTSSPAHASKELTDLAERLLPEIK